MTTLPFDTHEQIKKLIAVGFTEQQAEAIIDVILAASEQTLAKYRDARKIHATDLTELKTESNLNREIQLISLKLRDIEFGLTIKLGTLIVLAGGIITALLLKILAGGA